MLKSMAKKKSDYVPAPAISEEDHRRLITVMQVLTDEITVAAAAERLGLSRNRFQTIMHRGLSGLVEGLRPKEAGRPATPEKEAELEGEVKRLRRQNEQLQRRVEVTDRLLTAAGSLLKGSRAGRKPKAKTTEGGDDDDEPEGRLREAEKMRSDGVSARVAAAAVGKGASTLRRWRLRKRRGHALTRRPGPMPGVPAGGEAAARVVQLVRELGGVVGAAALAHSVPGVSRRQASELKRDTLTAMERERIKRCAQVTVTAPGIVRGFDAMHLVQEALVALISTDAAVPYRTSITLAEHYDGASVAAAIERDFAEHGAPLIWRADRARCHEVIAVRDVLTRYGVLLLHGPPHHPRYYGQLERQNREHRAWLDGARADARVDIERMRRALNGLWRRRTLGWWTAEEVWRARPRHIADRRRFRERVHGRAERLHDRLAGRSPRDLADRLAIEQVLIEDGLLRIKTGER